MSEKLSQKESSAHTASGSSSGGGANDQRPGTQRDPAGVEISGGSGGSDSSSHRAASSVVGNDRVWGFDDLWKFDEHIVRLYSRDNTDAIIFGHVGFPKNRHADLAYLIRDFNTTCMPLKKAVLDFLINRGVKLEFSRAFGVNVVNGPWTLPDYTVAGFYEGFLVCSDFVDELEPEKREQFDSGYVMELDSDNPTICGMRAYIDGHPSLFWGGEICMSDMNAAYINSVCESDNTSFLHAARLNRDEECESKRDCVQILKEYGCAGIFTGKSDDFMRLLILAVASEDVPRYCALVTRYSIDAKSDVYWTPLQTLMKKSLKSHQFICECMCRIFDSQGQDKLEPKFKLPCQKKMGKIQDKRLLMSDDQVRDALFEIEKARIDQRVLARGRDKVLHENFNARAKSLEDSLHPQILTGTHGFVKDDISNGKLVRSFNKRVKPLVDALEKLHEKLGIERLPNADGTFRICSGKDPIERDTPLFLGCGALCSGTQTMGLEYFSYELHRKIGGQDAFINWYSTRKEYAHSNINGFALQHSCRHYNVTCLNAADDSEVLTSRSNGGLHIHTTHGNNEMLEKCLEILGLTEEYKKKELFFVLPLVIFVSTERIEPRTQLKLGIINNKNWLTERAYNDIVDSFPLLSGQERFECPCESPSRCFQYRVRIKDNFLEDGISPADTSLTAQEMSALDAASVMPIPARGMPVEVEDCIVNQAPPLVIENVTEKQGDETESEDDQQHPVSKYSQPPETPDIGKRAREDKASPPESSARKTAASDCNADVEVIVVEDGTPPRPSGPGRAGNAVVEEVFVDLSSSPEVDSEKIEDAGLASPNETIDGAGPAPRPGGEGSYQRDSDQLEDYGASGYSDGEYPEPLSPTHLHEIIDSDTHDDCGQESASEGVEAISAPPAMNPGAGKQVRKLRPPRARSGRTKADLIDEHVRRANGIYARNSEDYQTFKKKLSDVRKALKTADEEMESIKSNQGDDANKLRAELLKRIVRLKEHLQGLEAVEGQFESTFLSFTEYRRSKNSLKQLNAPQIEELVEGLSKYRFMPFIQGDGGFGN